MCQSSRCSDMAWLVSPLKTADWRVDPIVFTQQLLKDWPCATLGGPLHKEDEPGRVGWIYPDGAYELWGVLTQASGSGLQFEGRWHLVFDFAAWFRRIAPPGELAVYDDSFNTVVPLTDGITADEILEQSGLKGVPWIPPGQ
jgi:hypothetical protein